MVCFSKLSGFTAALLTSAAVAHPGETHSQAHMKRELAARDHFASAGKRSLDACSDSASAQKLHARAIERRAQKVKDLREKRGIKTPAKKFRRDLAELEAWEEVNHNMTGSYSYDMFTAEANVFSANTSCVLAPEITDGPYYVVGEYMRSNVKESLYCDGVDLFLEVQYVDINTCEGVPTLAIDVWNANATGVYSGISTSGNYAAGGYNSTYLRGIQLTDFDGVVSFETIFPGHYEGRATHTHLLAHSNATVESNGTISVYSGAVTHIGQLFWDTELRDAVEEIYPYSTNTVTVTTNDEDMWAPVQASEEYDPFPQWLYLGDSLEDGLFAWIQIGVNVSADYTDDDYYSIAAYLDADGGHAESSSDYAGGSGSGNSTGNSTDSAAPSGTASFAATSSAA